MIPIEKLRWQCRRGTRELDFLLQAYLESEYLQADDEDKIRFIKLLDWEDDELLAVLLGDKEPDGPEFDCLVDKIRHFKATDNRS